MNMNNVKIEELSLRALREASGHTAAWCAQNVGHVALRSWQYWESGGRSGRPVRVPDDVMEAMRRLALAVQGVLFPSRCCDGGEPRECS